jgi:hypothetical protein
MHGFPKRIAGLMFIKPYKYAEHGKHSFKHLGHRKTGLTLQ